MSARDNAHKTLDIIIDRATDLARWPNSTDMSEFDFRYYMDKFVAGNVQRSLQFDLFTVYEEERKRLRGEQG